MLGGPPGYDMMEGGLVWSSVCTGAGLLDTQSGGAWITVNQNLPYRQGRLADY